jgi:acyl-CoA thioester hydrolase
MAGWDSSKNKEMETKVHTHRVRVRYADVDRMGVVYHARYLEWFEAARTEMMRTMGMAYRQLEERGIFLPVVEAYCRYRKPVLYDELIRVKTCIGEVSKSRIRLEYEITGEDDDSVRVEGYTVHCFTNRAGKPMRASHELLAFFQNVRKEEVQ